MGSLRAWLFRSLVAIAAGLMIASVIMPWWTADVTEPYQGFHTTIRIYQYGLRHDLVQMREYVEADETPFYQTALALVYLAASVGLMLWSTWLKERKGQLLLGGIGLIYIAYAAIAAFVVIANRTAELGIPFQGWSIYISETQIITSLRFGYYLAYAAGGMCIALALLRNTIIGRPKISA